MYQNSCNYLHYSLILHPDHRQKIVFLVVRNLVGLFEDLENSLLPIGRQRHVVNPNVLKLRILISKMFFPSNILMKGR